MAQKPPQNPSTDSDNSALARYLAKQKSEKQAQTAKQAPPKTDFRAALAAKVSAKPAAPSQNVPVASGKPSLANIPKPASMGPDPSAVTRRWDALPGTDLTETEARARESGAPAIPPTRESSSAMGNGFSEPRVQQTDSYAPITHQPLAADGLRAADFAPRAIALLIDWAILSVLSWPIKKVLFAILSMGFSEAVQNYTDGLSWLLYFVMVYFYYGYFYSTKAASPGKLMFGLAVYDADGVTKVSYWKAFFREAVGKVISCIPFFMGFVIVLIRDDRRALHDLLFDTRVIKKTEVGL